MPAADRTGTCHRLALSGVNLYFRDLSAHDSLAVRLGVASTGRLDYLEMIIGVYATLGIFLVVASRNPLSNLSLIWFTVWSSVVHAGIMAVQALTNSEHMGHLRGDVLALFLVAAVLAIRRRAAPRRQRLNAAYRSEAPYPSSASPTATSPMPAYLVGVNGS